VGAGRGINRARTATREGSLPREQASKQTNCRNATSYRTRHFAKLLESRKPWVRLVFRCNREWPLTEQWRVNNKPLGGQKGLNFGAYCGLRADDVAVRLLSISRTRRIIAREV
jgi:hypothetical protein